MGQRKVGPLEKRLRNWVRTRLREKDDGEERGEFTRFAEAVGWTTTQLDDYLKEPPERHFTFEQVVLTIRHFRLNVHQVTGEIPLPAADYLTRQMLAAWDQAAKTPAGRDARILAFDTLVQIGKLRGPFQPDAEAPLDELLKIETPPTTAETDVKKRGGKRGR